MTILYKLLKYYFMIVTIFFLGRVFLFIKYFGEFSQTPDMLLTFIYGLRMDTIVASFLLIIPLFLLTLSPKFLASFVNKFLNIYFLIVISIIIYIENATIPFFAQYDVRPNYLFVEYLIYPKEVFSTIIGGYLFELIVAFLLIILFAYFYIKKLKTNFSEVFNKNYFLRIALFLPIAVLLFIGIRSSFGHRAANNSDAMYTENRVLNEVTKNSIYSIGYSIYAYSNDSNENMLKRYGQISPQEALERVKNRLNIKNDEIFSLERYIPSNFPQNKKKNLVIFVQESVGAQFIGALGGTNEVTPNINKLSKEGIFFTNLYSNGTRSVRGLAGYTSGNLAVPGQGVVKRNKSQSGFFTFARVLKPMGYETLFLYGGESRFDNMRSWFLGNGFDKIIDQPQFENPSFTGAWGVSDEDLVIKANETFKNLYTQNKNFAALMFSTTNHEPFDFPDNKIELVPNVPKKSVENAIKFADYAIGKFIESARKEPYYKDTIFIIAADHNVRVYGNEDVPVSTFRVPAIILGDGITPQKYDKVSSQPDLLATALDLIGADMSAPIMGNSIFSDKKVELSLMQFNENYALRVGNKIAIIQPNKEAKTYIYENEKIVLTQSDDELEKDALAFVYALNNIYTNKLYK